MNSLLDFDRKLEEMQNREKWGIGRYRIWVRIKDGSLHPATGMDYASDNLQRVIEMCKSYRKTYNNPEATSEYIVCDEENDLVIVYPVEK